MLKTTALLVFATVGPAFAAPFLYNVDAPAISGPYNGNAISFGFTVPNIITTANTNEFGNPSVYYTNLINASYPVLESLYAGPGNIAISFNNGSVSNFGIFISTSGPMNQPGIYAGVWSIGIGAGQSSSFGTFATITDQVPEPSTAALALAGLALLISLRQFAALRRTPSIS